VGGGCGRDARIGERLDGRVPEEEAPRVIAALARYYLAERSEGETFQELVARVGVTELTRVALAGVEGAM
jgi:sulfite reductase beta subunit-like hemoprotein